MEEQELNKWWCHLTVTKKEEIASVACCEHVTYPACSWWWGGLSTESKETIYNISGGRDAHDHHKWKKGNTSFT